MRPAGRSRLRQIVPQKNVDADALLVGADGLTRTMREQDSRCGPGLVAGILVDDRIEGATDQETPRVLSQLVGNPDHLTRPSRGLERIGDATVSGATAVYAAQIWLAREQCRSELPRPLGVIATLDHRQREQVRILAGQDLVEAELPLSVIAQRQRSCDHGHRTLATSEEPSHQRCSGPACRRVVYAHI